MDGWRGGWMDGCRDGQRDAWVRSEEHTSELQSPCNLVCRLLLEKKIGHVLGALIAESDAGNPGGLAFVEALATGLSRQVALHAGVRQPRAALQRGGLSTVSKRRALELMELRTDGRLSEELRTNGRLSVESLANEVGLSPAHFSRAFKETMGVPPHRY